jgi:hypothetical protein
MMNKPLTISVVCATVAIVGGTVAITYDATKANDKLPCALTWEEAKYEDDFCTAYVVDDHVVIGPLSDVTNEHIVGS